MFTETTKATAQRLVQVVSYISAPYDWFVQQNTAVLGPPGVIWFIFIMGAARVSKHIAHRDNKRNMQETLVCGQVSQLQDLLSLLEAKTRYKLHRRDRRLSLSPLCKRTGVPQRLGAGLDPAPFPMWCSHRGAKSTWISMHSRKITSLFPLWKKEGQIFAQKAGWEARFCFRIKEAASCCLIFPL